MRFTGGLPETACGYGSTLRATETLRAELPGLLKRLGVGVLLDAPCGDLNWLADVELGVAYIGIDISEENLKTARANAPGRMVAKMDILSDYLPPADAVLCRDFLQHLPSDWVWWALGNMRDTGARWLIATSHDAEVNADIDAIGGFRPLNLQVDPFSLGEPVAAIEDGPGRILGVWPFRC